MRAAASTCAQLRVDEDARHDARAGQPRDHVARARASWPAMSSPPSVVTSCRPSGTSIAISGFSAQAIADHLVGGRHLEVELDVRELAQPPHVLVLDVAAVLAQVHGDAVGAAQVRLDRRPDRVGLVGAPRLADRGDVVDVDAELDHAASSSLCRSRTMARVESSCPLRQWWMSMRMRLLACARRARVVELARGRGARA